MGRPQKSNVYKANATALGDMGPPLRTAGDKVLESAARVHEQVLGFDWQGHTKDAVDERAEREYMQDRAVAAAYDKLADAYENGAKAMQPMIESLKSNAQGLEGDHFNVSEDWAVTDTYDYAAARTLAKLMDPDDTAGLQSQVDQLQAHRANVAATETNNLQRLAGQLGAADAETARAINDAKHLLSDTTNPNAPPTVLVDQDLPASPLPDDPNQFTQAWNSLTQEQKDAEYNRNHFIGNHPGMPFPDRDHYNRLHLPELQNASQADLDRLRTQHPDWANGKEPFLPSREYRNWKAQWDAANRAREGYSKVKDNLGPPPGKMPPGELPRYLGFIDDQGRAAVSINNPDTAKRNATFIPGTGQDLTRFDASALKSERMLSATLAADKSLHPSDVSVTTWMGYDRPMNLIDAASTSYAHNGAAALDDFQAGLRASHNDALTGGPSLNTVIGHSYGSTELGAAALGGHHLDANNVVAVGSPGVLAGHASDLDLDPGAHVFATRAQNDVIGVVTGMTLGPDPMSSKFGGIPFEAAPGPGWPLGLPTVTAHSSYWDPGNPALDNMGRIIAGRVDVTPPTFTP
ncbi:alpha/beta hydrolase [Mycobacterium sp. MUNTM1]